MCAELLEKHLDLQEKKDVWIESVGITQKGILRNSYTSLPLTIPVKGKQASSGSQCCIMQGHSCPGAVHNRLTQRTSNTSFVKIEIYYELAIVF